MPTFWPRLCRRCGRRVPLLEPGWHKRAQVCGVCWPKRTVVPR